MRILQFEITEDDIYEAVSFAFDTHYIDNLRHRNIFVKLDSCIRGFLGECSFRRWLEDNGVVITSSNMTSDGSSIDSDLVYTNEFDQEIVIEIKTSLIPDVWRDLATTLERADIKIIKREWRFEDTHGDFHVQIYFNFLTKQRDDYLSSLDIELNNIRVDELVKIMKLRDYKQAFVAWTDKKSLSKFLNNEAQKTWRFGMREFWRCPIDQVSKEPEQFIPALKKYIK